MKTHITNLYGLGGTAGKIQQMVADIAKTYLHYNELGIYCYKWPEESQEQLWARIDGIIAAVNHGDIIIFQHPTWNETSFEETLFWKLSAYSGLKKIIFIHDVIPLMFETNYYLLDRYINLYNQADLIIVPSSNMADFLRSKGLSVAKIVVQRMWDCMISIDTAVIPQFKKLIHFAGDINEPKFSFVRERRYDAVKLVVTAEKGAWADGKNIDCIGWINEENILANTLRKNGGFGLLWTEETVFKEYMKFNANTKLSTYLAAGLPVIVPRYIPEADTILGKNLGIAVNSLDEAVDRIEHMNEEEYRKMGESVESFSNLLRQGYFTKKALVDAVFQLLND